MTGPAAPVPPAGPAGTGAGAGLTLLGPAEASALPVRLQALGRAVVLTGMVIGAPADGSVRVRTQAGEIRLRAGFAMPRDGKVTVQVPAGAAATARVVLYAAGGPPAPGGGKPAGSLDGQPPPASGTVTGPEPVRGPRPRPLPLAQVPARSPDLPAGATAPGAAARPMASGAPPDQSWTALRTALAVLAAGHPDAARVLAGMLPAPNRRLAANLLAILHAMRGGEVGAWLARGFGAAAGTPERGGRSDLFERLCAELHDSVRKCQDQAGTEWSVFDLPLLAPDGLATLRFAVRPVDDQDPEKRRQGEAESRFVVELSLSRLGPLQLDGLVRGRRFDLIIRSRQPLPDSLTAELLNAFDSCLAATGATGRLLLSADGTSWLRLPPVVAPVAVTT